MNDPVTITLERATWRALLYGASYVIDKPPEERRDYFMEGDYTLFIAGYFAVGERLGFETYGRETERPFPF